MKKLIRKFGKGKAYAIIASVAVVIILIVCGIIYFSQPKEPSVYLSLKTTDSIKHELGDSLEFKTEDYIDISKLSEEQIKALKMDIVIPVFDENEKVNLKESKAADKDNIKTGTYALVFTLGEEQAYLDIIVVDTTAPKFTKSKDEYKLEEGSKKPDFKKDFKAEDLSGEVTITIDEGKLVLSKPGKYTLKAIAKDASGNQSEKEFIVFVTEKPEEPVSPPSSSSSSNSTTSSNSSSSNSTTSSNNSSSEGNSGGTSSNNTSSSNNSSSGNSCNNCADPNLPPDAIYDPVNGYLTFGYYPSMEAAIAAGESMMLQEYSGKIADQYAVCELFLNDWTLGSVYALIIYTEGESYCLNSSYQWVVEN